MKFVFVLMLVAIVAANPTPDDSSEEQYYGRSSNYNNRDDSSENNFIALATITRHTTITAQIDVRVSNNTVQVTIIIGQDILTALTTTMTLTMIMTFLEENEFPMILFVDISSLLSLL
eukprot:TRINITY_DN10793_c0_g1_i2.p1 TRINITY_DN10793_c0_g1~~TRINITY_DN10793_c0_g1_i2.p1  ORF type:complete len:118 (-),score=2.17 TRINITY_DN10793_c0_g1_i2:119-472(-)